MKDKWDALYGRVISIGFFYSSTGRKKDVFRVEVDLKDADPKMRKKVIDHAMKLAKITGGKP
jgi:hypothetical protein